MALALLYNLSDQAKLRALRFAFVKFGVRARVVAPEEFAQPVGLLCAREGFSPATAPVEGGFSDEMLVLDGLSEAQLDRLLDTLRRSRVHIALKAVVTKENAAWSSLRLHDELEREHEAMKAVRAQG